MNSLLKKYNKIPAPAKASLWYTVTQVFQKGIGFIVVPLYTRILTSHDYGRYTVFTSWYEVMLIFGTLRLYSNSFSVGLTKYGDDKDRFTSSLLGFGWVCTLCFYFVALFFRNQFESWLEMPFYLISLLFLEIFWQPALGLWSQRQRYAFRYKALNAVTAISAATTPLLGLLLITLLPDQGLGAILGKCMPQIFAGIFCAILILKKNKNLYISQYWRYIFCFNVPLIFYYLAQVLLNQMDRIMIQKMGTLSQVAIYGVANSAAFALSIVSNAVNNSFIPYMFQKMKAGEDSSIRGLANILVIVVALFNFILIVLAPEAMKLMAPLEYREGMYLIPPLVCSVVVMFIYQMYCNVEFYYEKKYFLMCASILVCICNGILNFIFISEFGYLAAGYTTLLSHILCLIAHFICVKKILGNERRVFHNSFIIFIGISFLICSGIMLLLYNFPMIRYSILALLLFVAVFKRKMLFEKLKELKK